MSASEILALGMLPVACLVLLTGYPAAFVLGGLAVLFAFGGWLFGFFDLILLSGTPLRIFGLMSNATLVAIPLFLFMGNVLNLADLARGLLLAIARAIGPGRSGLAIAVILSGGLMAASTGVAGASIVTIGLVALPVMLQAGVDRGLAAGSVAAAGTLGQLIPPSIALVILADVIGAAHQEAQLRLGNFAPDPLSIVDLFAACLVPGLLLVVLYVAWLWQRGSASSVNVGTIAPSSSWWLEALPLAALVLAVLGSIFMGLAAPSEGAAIGAGGAVLLAWLRKGLDLEMLLQAACRTVVTTGMIFFLIIGATMFALVFRELGGADLIARALNHMPGGQIPAILLGMALIFILGFFMEFIELVILVVPLLATPLFLLGADPLWLAVLIAINLQTSFLTPPLGVALFYVRGVAPREISTLDIYRGAVPFIFLQLLLLALVLMFPWLATALPDWL